MTDRIVVEGLRAETVIGLYDWERRVRQSIRIDLELECDLQRAGASDRVADTVDYKAVSSAVRDRVESSRYQLIETLAADAAETCLGTPGVLAARITVHKPGALRHAENVLVSILRREGDPSGRAPHTAFVGIGSNVDPVENVRAALTALHDEFGALRVSGAYRTAAVGAPGSPDFLNLAVELRTDLPPPALSDWLHGLEQRQGRKRTADRNAPRTIDLDLLLYDDLVRESAPQLPDPLVESAAFVLVPLADIAAAIRHPTAGVTIGELRERLPIGIDGVDEFDDAVLF